MSSTDLRHANVICQLSSLYYQAYCACGWSSTISHPHSKKVGNIPFTTSFENAKLLKIKRQYKDLYKPVPKGTKRYEVQATRAELQKYHHETLDVFTINRINKDDKNFWKSSNYGKVINLQLV